MVRILFEQIAMPSKLSPLGLDELLDWSEEALNRVDRTAFFDQFEATHAVQYFYEPFLEAFDPDLRRQLGVWYTPPEVVRYMVAKVHASLREDFGLKLGLGDPRVFVLDPCTGTGSFLVEVLRTIAVTLAEEQGDALVSSDIKDAAMRRIIGFELLPAPFVVAHLQLGLLLASLGTPLDQTRGERAAVYLTNSLTGWETSSAHQQIVFPELEEERGAAESLKRDAPILVVIGNPPYNGFAGVSPREEGGLVKVYKAGLRERWGRRAASDGSVGALSAGASTGLM
jgi:predicted helicase